MANKDQIKNEFFISLLKRPYEAAINDVVVDNVVRLGLTNKYQFYLTADEYNSIGDELVEAGYFKWNDNGKLALTAPGLKYLSRFR